MKKIYLALMVSAFCFPLFGQNLASNQVRVNGRTFTLGTNTYNADYDVIFNQWYRGHANAEQAKQGEDLSWINDFTRAYTLGFLEGNLAINDNALGAVKIIAFSKSGGTRSRLGGIGILRMLQWLVYDGATGILIGAQLHIEAYNAYASITPDFFDVPEFSFPLRVGSINTPLTNFDAGRNLVSYKTVYQYETDSSITNGVRASIYSVNSETAKKLKDADDFARTMRREVPALFGNVAQPNNRPGGQNVNSNATHRLTADLNVFAEQDGGSAIMASPKKGDPVQVLEYGEYADWNGITAKWAKVTTSDNKTGWLFSGYLEELRK
jgi:hypothetical protein